MEKKAQAKESKGKQNQSKGKQKQRQAKESKGKQRKAKAQQSKAKQSKAPLPSGVCSTNKGRAKRPKTLQAAGVHERHGKTRAAAH